MDQIHTSKPCLCKENVKIYFSPVPKPHLIRWNLYGEFFYLHAPADLPSENELKVPILCVLILLPTLKPLNSSESPYVLFSKLCTCFLLNSNEFWMFRIYLPPLCSIHEGQNFCSADAPPCVWVSLIMNANESIKFFWACLRRYWKRVPK